MSTAIVEQWKQCQKLTERLEKYEILLEGLEDKDRNYLFVMPFPYNILTLIFVLFVALFVLALMGSQGFAWWIILIAVIFTMYLCAAVGRSLLKNLTQNRILKTQRRVRRPLEKLALLGSEEIANLGMGTIDQIAQETELRGIDLNILESLMDIMTQKNLVEKILLADNQYLYKSLVPRAQMNIVTEVIQVD